MTAWTSLALLAFAGAFAHALRMEAWRRAFEAYRQRIPAPAPALPAETPGEGMAPVPAPGDVAVTLVVPARDAAETLIPLLQDLYAQTHARDRLQVVVVDDHSTDGTPAIVERMALRWPGLLLVRLSATEGKKAAITAGVKAASGILVVLTDADARCAPRRVEAVVRHWQAEHWDLLLLPVRTSGEGFLGMLQEEEQGALLGAAVGLLDEGRPLLANGANLAFTKAAFESVGGYTGDPYASGDDVFLLERVRRNRGRVSFLLDADALVTVEAERTSKGFVQQRLRWAGKMRGVRDGGGKMLAGAGLLLPWTLVVITILLTAHLRIGDGFLYAWGLMVAAWCAWLVPVLGLAGDARRFLVGTASRWRSLPALLAFTLYAPVIAVAALFVRPKWKGRRV